MFLSIGFLSSPDYHILYKCPCKKLSTPPSTGDCRRSKSDKATAFITDNYNTLLILQSPVGMLSVSGMWQVREHSCATVQVQYFST